jgi:hypothetical protein
VGSVEIPKEAFFGGGETELIIQPAMPLLTEAAYLATFRPPMRKLLDLDVLPVVDFWPYADSIPAADFAGYDGTDGRVEYVWQSGDGEFEHVLINTAESRDVFMVIVIDRRTPAVVGHYLLDLPTLYGLAGA